MWVTAALPPQTTFTTPFKCFGLFVSVWLVGLFHHRVQTCCNVFTQARQKHAKISRVFRHGVKLSNQT